jgi:bifunctional DNA-binding transcriptional regulator/antitoxin component of YhaV-PrlF toxin-antitoxin module
MGYPTKVQLIKRAKSEQWYINFPSALAQAIEFKRGEIVEWIIDDHQRLILKRGETNLTELKVKLSNKQTKEVL